ncbi:B3/4 domain-containing protein [Microbacterium excoecariae]|uniref:B3/B4 domain-containing protein n=1 Tax=Microbacterium excoecariae TaxID=2715210 RepID=UPI00140E8CC0|nr:phenylalanine--tRNA ligase beta subunit-related protein [Microbacterium excoecariae]NHI16932.1 hypothetical protein [Microbacterium excoecariae]
MTDLLSPDAFFAASSVDPAVHALRPDYRALLVIIDGIDQHSSAGLTAADELIAQAEAYAKELLAGSPVDELPHIAAWRDAYRAFGAKPQRTRNSLEALTRRAEQGLPRVNALTDIYNAISVLCQIPFGGEDYARYQGPARLVRATGDEDFATTVNGEPTIEHPESGEVVWTDDAGVTCRRWNWRQGPRTALREDSTSALFILDALDPVTDAELHAAADALVDALSALGEDVRATSRLLSRA